MVTGLEEIKLAKEVGRAGGHKYIFINCPKCNKGRWIPLYLYKKGKQKICRECDMEDRRIIKIKFTPIGCSLGKECLNCIVPLNKCPNESKEEI